MKSRVSLFAPLAIVALMVCGQQAFAADVQHHQLPKPMMVHHTNPGSVDSLAVEPSNLYALWSVFTAAPPSANSDGSGLWPCFGATDTSTGSVGANPDCPTTGDPAVQFPSGGAQVGSPAYTWSLSDCDLTSTSSPGCGESETFYEDNTADLTDDLIYSVAVVQGTSPISNSGTYDFGPNAYGVTAADYPFQGVFTGFAFGFGTAGQTGANNGACSGSFGTYPLAAASYPGEYVVPANKTCVAPVAGVATLTATTELAKPTYTHSTSKTVCTNESGPTYSCYTVKFTKVFEVSQKWTIYLK